MQIRKKDLQTIEIQMGPMIDLVFLLLVFFMITTHPHPPEVDLSLSLPGTVAQNESLNLPDEQRVCIKKDGQIVLNDQPLDSPTQRHLPQLLSTLMRFQELSTANKMPALLTLDVDDEVLHQRIVDVMNVCAQAKITHITFATSSPTEENEP